MDPYIVKVYCEGQEWYVHENGARVNNRETAMLFNYADAVKTLSFYTKFWKAECEMIRVNRLTREDS